MTPTELAKRLAHMYDNARQGETATMVHLFGIRYADELRRCGETPLRNLSTTLRHWRLRFTEQSLLLWLSRVG